MGDVATGTCPVDGCVLVPKPPIAVLNGALSLGPVIVCALTPSETNNSMYSSFFILVVLY